MQALELKINVFKKRKKSIQHPSLTGQKTKTKCFQEVDIIIVKVEPKKVTLSFRRPERELVQSVGQFSLQSYRNST